MTAIEQYVILETISDNERKSVYRCREDVSGNTVILKVLKSEFAGHEEVMRFKQEYRLLTELAGSAEGVIKPRKLEERNGYYIMVLEDIGGRSLKRIMAEEKPPLDTLLRVVVKLVDIIGTIHEHQVIHKDIKPSNIIWEPEQDVVQLIDFDLAVKLSKEKRAFLNSGVLEGSLLYISPEQTGRMNRSIDYRTDFYSLGVMLYEMTTGVKPFDFPDILDQIYSIIAKEAVPPYELTQGAVPRSLSAVIMKLIEKAPEDRYRSIYGIKSDLLRCLAGEDGFEPGSEDKRNLFRISQKIYGREEDIKRLSDAFKASIRENPQLMLISGEAGVGKTALVSELHPYISQDKGLFAEGKFDQYNKNIPYSAVIQAFRGLIGQMCSGLESGERETLAESLRSSLDGNGKLIAGLIPELEELIGVQPEVERLNPAEETNRFFMTFINFVSGIIANERPLVLFLDDVQWADPSTLQLLEKLLLSNHLRRLFVICAYRQHETPKGHPLFAAVDEIERNGRAAGLLHLTPISPSAVGQLVADTLYTDTEAIGELSNILYARTKGNAFFINEILKDLYDKKLLYFADNEGIWKWRLDEIGKLDINENIVEFLMGKLRILPEGDQRVLRLCAAIGSQFEFNMLMLIGEVAPEEIASSLVRAVDNDLIVPADTNYSLLSQLSEERGALAGQIEVSFRFQHDRIQQAFYQMIDPGTVRQLHLTIGRLLLAHLAPEEIPDKIVDIVSHINKGLSLLEERDEIDRIIGLNLQAALKAKAAFGYEAAFDLLEAGISLMPGSSWKPEERITWDYYRHYAECSYLTHHTEAGDKASSFLLGVLKDELEVARVYEMQASHYMYLGMMKESIAAGRQGLKVLGIRIPEKPGMAAVLKEFAKFKLKLRGVGIEDIFAKPEMRDARIKTAMRLLINIFPPAFISGETNVFALVVLKKAELSLVYGISPESAIAFVGYSILLSGFGDIQGAFDFGRLAIRINDKFNDLQWRGAALVLYTLFCHVWKEPWDTLQEWFGKSIDASLRTGSLMYLAHACYYVNLWNPSMDLVTALNESETYISMIEMTKYKESLATAILARQQLLGLAGELDNPLSFDGEDFTEAGFLAELEEAKYFSGIAIYYIYKMKQLFTFEEYREALAYMEKADSIISTLAGSAFMEEFSLYAFLNLAHVYPSMSVYEKAKARRRMRKEYGRMKKWAAHNPEPFGQLELLMKAEWARITNQSERAGKYYELAVRACEKSSFVRYKALAYELAAKFYNRKELLEFASYMMRQSLYYYSVWGAKGKVRQLDDRYGDLIKPNKEFMPGRSVTETTESLDLNSILLASQAISKEIELDHLLETMMEIVIKNAGAQRGCIVMRSNTDLLVQGEYNPEEDKVSVSLHRDRSRAEIPSSIIRHVEESKETVIYNDAFSETDFVNDPYILNRHPKSLVCMPLINHNKTVAVIYLENNLVTGVFTKERMRIINLLSREMVFSLENASLYSDLEESEEKYRTLVNNMQDGLFITQDRKLKFANSALARMMGYRLEEMIDQPFQDFVHPEEREKVMGYYARRIDGKLAPYEYETRLVKKDTGQEVYVIQKVSMTEFMDKPAIQGTVKDITERKKAEEELRRHKEHLEELVNERTQELERNNEELNRNIQLIQELSITDELTGVYNRRYFNTVFLREVNRAKREKGNLTYIMLDIDYYKKYNDTYGHYEGDNVLRKLGKTLREYIRPLSDYVFRLGGEEFGVVAPGLTAEEAWELAEGIRTVVEELRIEHSGSRISGHLTVSVGVAAVKVDGMNENDLYKLADDALYQSKAGGRNRVTLLQ